MSDLNQRAGDALRRLEEQGKIVGWQPGMLQKRTEPPDFWYPRVDRTRRPVRGTAPDLSDPLTVMGCLLLLREAVKDGGIIVLAIDYGPGGTMWQCQATAGGRRLTMKQYGTEAEAIVAALEAVAR